MWPLNLIADVRISQIYPVYVEPAVYFLWCFSFVGFAMRWWSRHQRGQNNSYKIKYFIFWSLAVNRRCCGCEAGCPKVVQRIRTLQINWKQDKDWGSALRINSQRNRERLRWSQRRTKDVKKEKPHEELPFKGSGSKITQSSSKRQTGSTGRGATPALDWRRWRCRKAVV